MKRNKSLAKIIINLIFKLKNPAKLFTFDRIFSNNLQNSKLNKTCTIKQRQQCHRTLV